MTERARSRRGPKDAIVCGDVGEHYVGPHAKDPNPDDEGFCFCGLGLDAWVHTDSEHYVSTPLVARSEFEGQWRPVEPIHSLACTQLNGVCRSMHCPYCGVMTGSQGHAPCPERPQ